MGAGEPNNLDKLSRKSTSYLISFPARPTPYYLYTSQPPTPYTLPNPLLLVHFQSCRVLSKTRDVKGRLYTTPKRSAPFASNIFAFIDFKVGGLVVGSYYRPIIEVVRPNSSTRLQGRPSSVSYLHTPLLTTHRYSWRYVLTTHHYSKHQHPPLLHA